MVRFIVDCKECKTTKERAQKVVIELLHNFQGAVQTDGYDVYSIYENKKGVLLLSCWAHARRKYTEVLKEDKSGAELRQRLAYPILVAFEKWVVNYFPKAIPDGRMHRALRYTYNLFQRLSRYHLDGRYKPDNNQVENAIHPLSIERKNFMFCGNHDAAENAAIMYSLFGCCKASDVNPREWLTVLLSSDDIN